MAAGAVARRPRDPRLDFFRGLAMFIILLAHTPGNSWTLWIPARFGFSDATEIFVFCSGMASALAFGSVFAERGWLLGAARIGFRVWQVYWAHVGVFLFTAAMLMTIDLHGLGLPGKRYSASPYVVPFFERTGEALVGLLTLTYVPGLFDILPMYLAILAMTPLVMALHRVGGTPAAAGFVAASWLAANLAGYARGVDLDLWSWGEGPLPHDLAVWAGARLQALNLPGSPWRDATWFFNPFAWQLVFFAGFAFGMGWLKPPPVDRRLILAAAGFVLLSVPFAWFKIHGGFYLPPDWALQIWIAETREAIQPLWWKTWQGAFRSLHFLALAYLAWIAVGPGGVRLSEGLTPRLRPAARRRLWAGLAALVAIPTAPYAYVDEIKTLAPALDAWLMTVVPLVDGDRIGLIQLAHLAALIAIVWNQPPQSARDWALRVAVIAIVPVIRKVGTQSLAVFMASIPLARFNGLLLDLAGRDVWTRAAINLFGFAVLIAIAYLVSWIKSHPWRRPSPDAATAASRRAAPAE